MLKSLSKPMQYALLGVLALAAWLILSPMLFPEPVVSRSKKPLPKKVTKKGELLYTEEDMKAHFDPVAVPLKNAFKPLVAKVVTSRGTGASAVQVNNVPTEFAGGEANWIFTGSAEVDGILQALLENRTTGEGVFLKVGDSWKGIYVEEITEDSLVLASHETGVEKTLRLPTEEAGPNPAALAPATVGQPPLQGQIGPLTIQPDGSGGLMNGNGDFGNFGGGGGGRRRGGGGGGRRRNGGGGGGFGG